MDKPGAVATGVHVTFSEQEVWSMARVALITAASREIGAATASVLAKQSYPALVNHRTGAPRAKEVGRVLSGIPPLFRRPLGSPGVQISQTFVISSGVDTVSISSG
jgi:hypothetical protein